MRFCGLARVQIRQKLKTRFEGQTPVFTNMNHSPVQAAASRCRLAIRREHHFRCPRPGTRQYAPVDTPSRSLLRSHASAISARTGRCFYNALNSDFRDAFTLLNPVDDVPGGKVHYNAAITPWFRLTADLQVWRPASVAQDTTLALGLRARIIL